MRLLNYKKKRNKTVFKLPLKVAAILLGIALIIGGYILLYSKLAEAAPWSSVHGSWNKRKQLTLVNNSGSTLSTNIPYQISINTQALYSLRGDLQSNCNDLRIVYQPDASTNTELARDYQIAYGSTDCSNSSATLITFPLQAAITNGSSDSNYYMYYSNPTTGAPSATRLSAYNINGKTATLAAPFYGTTTAQAAGSGTPNSSSGPIRYTGGKSALNFNGVNNYVAIASDVSSLKITGSLTLSAWIYLNDNTAQHDIICKYTGTAATSAYCLNVSSAGKLVMQVVNSTGPTIVTTTGATTLTPQTWYHVVGVFTSASSVTLYVNGVQDVQNTTSIPTTLQNPTTILDIGTENVGASNFFNGFIDEVQVSNIARYTANFTTSTAPVLRDANTQLLFHFDENGDDLRATGKAIDDSVNGNNGTLTNSPKYVGGLVGVDGQTSTPLETGKSPVNSYASHQGVFAEETTTNKITNPSFENGVYNTNWTAGGSITATQNITAPFYKFGASSAKLVASATDTFIASVSTASTATHNLSAYVYNNTGGSIGGTVDSSVASLVYDGIAVPTNYTNMGGGWWRLSNSSTYLNYYYVGGGQFRSNNLLQPGILESYALTNQDSDQPIFSTTSNQSLAQGFKVSSSTTIDRINLLMKRVGGSATTLGFKIEIQTDSAGVPSGTVITNGTSDCMISPNTSFSTTTPGVLTFTYTSLPSLTSATQYYIVLKPYTNTSCATPQAAANAASYDTWSYDASASSYANGDRYTYNGTTWTVQTGQDHVFELHSSTISGNYGVQVLSGKTVYVDGAQLEALPFATSYADGSLGTGYSWSGTANNSSSVRATIALAYSASSNVNTSEGSVSLWIKPTIFFNGYANGGGAILNLGGGGSMTLKYDGNPFGSTGKISIGAGGTTGECPTITGTTTYATGKWYHIVWTWSTSANNCKLYVNSNLEGTGNSYGGMGFQSPGVSANSDSVYSDMRFYSSVLTTGDISDLYNVGLGSHQESAFAQKSNPVLYWKFDESQGTSAQDSSAHNATGTLSNFASPPTGISGWQAIDKCVAGKCLAFNGTNNFISKSYFLDTQLDPGTSDMSLSTWFRHSSTAPASGTHTLIARYATGGYKLYMNTSGYICFGIDTAGSFGPADSACSTAAQGSYADSKWHYASAVKNGTTSITLYVDGIQVGQDASIAATGSLSGSSPTFYVGIDSDGSSNPWSGSIDEVKIYGEKLTAGQVLSDYNSRSNTGLASAIFGGSVNQPDALSKGLAGYWKMDESSWTNNCSTASVLDSSGNSNNGTSCPNSTGPTGGATGKFGNGGLFDGVNDYVSVAATSSINSLPRNGGSLTVSAWTKLGGAFTDFTIAAKSANGNGNGWNLRFSNSTSISMTLRSSTTAANTICSSSSFADTTIFHHIVTTYNDATDRIAHIYFDGKEASCATQTAAVGTLDSDSTYNLTIGSLESAFWFFNGTIDEVRVYNRALSGTDVQNLYNFAPGPVGYWKLDEDSNTRYDTSGNGNNLTASGTNISSKAGKYGKGVYYTASDYNSTLSITDASQNGLEPAGQLTISGWLYLNSFTGCCADALISKGTQPASGGATQLGYKLAVSNSGSTNSASFSVSSDGVTYTSITSPQNTITANTWYYITGVYDGSTIKIYINSVLQNSTNYSSNIFNNNGPFNIGGENYTGGGGLISDGHLSIIDDVRVYNYARNPQQIIKDMNASRPSISSPVGYWKLDEGTGTTANNSGIAGSAINGTIVSSPTWSNSGKFGKALTFVTASSQYVTVPDNTSLKPSTFSLSFWIMKNVEPATNDRVFAKHNSAKTQGWASLFDGTTPARKAYFAIYNTAATEFNTASINTVLPLSTWRYYTYVFDGSTLYAYEDGIPRGSTAFTGTFTPDTNALIFAANQTFNGNFPSVTLDEVKFYNYPLTSDEVKLDMNRGQAQVLGALSDNSSYEKQAANQEYCVPGDATSCAAPVGRWDFQEGTGTTVQDSSGNGKTGTWGGTGNPHWKGGKNGLTGNFNGSDDFVSTGLDVQPSAMPSTTWEAWIYPTSSSSKRNVFTDDDGGFDRGVESSRNGDGLFNIFTGSTTWTPVASTLNQWQHIAVVYTPTNILFYKNGVQYSLGSAPTTGTTVLNFNIGRNPTGAGIEWFQGQIDHVKVFNYARTAAQIGWDYNKGGPVGWWKFDECQGTTANDATGNSLTGTITIGATGTQTAAGTCNSGLSTSAWNNGATGKYNYSLNFDGTDDYVSIANNSLLNFGTGNFTLSSWIKTANANQYTQFFAKRDPNSPFNQYSVGIGSITNAGSTLNSGKTIFYFDNGTSEHSYHTQNNIIDGNWHHIVVTRTSGVVLIYVDGVNQTLVTDTSTSAAASNSDNTVQMTIGSGNGSGTYFAGQIDDARVYSYPLTAIQIKNLYSQGSAVQFAPSIGAP